MRTRSQMRTPGSGVLKVLLPTVSSPTSPSHPPTREKMKKISRLGGTHRVPALLSICRREWRCSGTCTSSSVDFEKVYEKMSRPAHIFDGRNLLDHDKLREIGFLVEGVGKGSPPSDE